MLLLCRTLAVVWLVQGLATSGAAAKKERPFFLHVEEAIGQNQALLKLPSPAELKAAHKMIADALNQHKPKGDQLQALDQKISALKLKHNAATAKLLDFKAQFDSKTSFHNIEVENNGPDSPAAKKLTKELDELKGKLKITGAEWQQLRDSILQLEMERKGIKDPLQNEVLKALQHPEKK